MGWIVTLHRQFIKSILSGDKTLEVRTRIPKSLRVGDRIYCVEAGSHGKIRLCFTVSDIVSTDPEMLWDSYAGRIQVNYLAYSEYFKGRTQAFGIGISNVTPLKNRDTDFIPQWFKKINDKTD